MQIIGIDEKEAWNNIIKSFPRWDVYYLNEYAKSLEVHGDGEPILIYLKKGSERMAYIMMQNDIGKSKLFKDILEKRKYFDWTTPYGYGGPLYDGQITDKWMKDCMDQVYDYAKKNNIVSQFFRFHPLLQNQKPMENVSRVIYTKKTIYIDTSSQETLIKNMTPNNRNMVRKAKKKGVEIFYDYGKHIGNFKEIYQKTMKMHEADDYYNFEDDYFEYLISQMKKNIIIFYAKYEGKIISSSIFFYNNRYMHYHLSGTLPEYRGIAAANLLLTEASLWAYEHGIQMLHLGGGVEAEDSLLRFKKHFNRNGIIDFCIGANIFNAEEFDYLVNIRKKHDESFDDKKKFMILYRA